MKKLIQFDKIDSNMYQVMDQNGNVKKNYVSKISDKKLVEIYSQMVVGREIEKKILQWQRIGKMLTFAPGIGEEALQFATAMAMNKKKDWLVPSFRSFQLMNQLGVKLHQLFLYWNGNELGSKYDDGVNVLPINITIGAQMSQAIGIGYAFHLKKQNGVAVTFIGDGGTAEGEFYEAMNLASIYNWPVVFCINNNQWSISTPRDKSSKVFDLSTKAIAAGVGRIQVDGNDLLASYDAIQEAIEHARSRKGPVLVEFVTYRMGPHTTSDDPSIYRTKEQEEEGNKKDPLIRLNNYLTKKKLWDEKKQAKIIENAKGYIQSEYDQMVLLNKVDVDGVFQNTFESLDEDLIQQRQMARKYFR